MRIELLEEQVPLLLVRRFIASSAIFPDGQRGLSDEANTTAGNAGEEPESTSGTEVGARQGAWAGTASHRHAARN